jgi:hypothetical protein
MRTMPRIQEEPGPRVGKFLLKDERIYGRDFHISGTIYDEGPLPNPTKIADVMKIYLQCLYSVQDAFQSHEYPDQ